MQRTSYSLLLVLVAVSGLVAVTESAENTATYAHESETIGTVREIYDGRLFPDIQINTFRNIHRLFSTRVVKRGATVTPIARSAASNTANVPIAGMARAEDALQDFSFSTDGSTYDLFDVLSLNRVAAMMIVKDDEVQFERYFMGNDAATRWMSMSMVKTIAVMLIGAAIEDGHIDSIEDPVTKYLPVFVGSAYDGVTIEQIIAMTSGVAWSETYTDPASDRCRMLDAQIGQQPGAILQLMAGIATHSAPGTRWNYSTGETHIAGALVRAATGKWAADYLSEKLWGPLGMESDATWWLESADGLEVGGSGLSATLRDYTRIGQFLLDDGVIAGNRVVPEGFVARAGQRIVVNGEPVDYGYGLWPLHDNSYASFGIFGQ